ncbi:hypothetical protein V5738_16330 [Salinisphaera sp. SPP-AMP-43]|uniref:hypothetical protein n=1 Tax=Salinisphaera sp. SPP-AMP-43 TaxID=3121288 RepID=UPI003C6DDF37
MQGAASALAAHALARADADTVAVIDCGVQGHHQLRALAALRPVRRVRAFDRQARRRSEFAQCMADASAAPVEPFVSAGEALRDSDIALVATESRKPVVAACDVPPRLHVSTRGADQPGKSETAAELIEAGVFICDDRQRAVSTGAALGRVLRPWMLSSTRF